jgi:ABC-2 type transport system permease protein
VLTLFGGLMLFGASNFRQYYAAELGVMDKYAVSLMNLSGTAILLCAGLSRFVFPLISLEGRKFWILGLTPVSRDQILRGKFAFAATGSLVVAESLILLSDMLLALPWQGLLLHAAAVAVVGVGLSALNVGLGAYMPTFRETDPSKIVVGFGGTVNMVIGLAFLVSVIGVMVVPFHVAQLAKGAAGGSGTTGAINLWVYAGIPAGLIIGALAVVLPLRAGAKSLRDMEF